MFLEERNEAYCQGKQPFPEGEKQMKKLAVCLLALLLVFTIPLYSGKKNYKFIKAADISVNDNGTATDGAEFDSEKLPIKAEEGAITVKFKPATPAAKAITFEILVSPDNGTTWTSKPEYTIAVDTDETQDGDGVVIVLTQVNAKGITHAKLGKVTVASGAGNCTEINAIISFVW